MFYLLRGFREQNILLLLQSGEFLKNAFLIFLFGLIAKGKLRA